MFCSVNAQTDFPALKQQFLDYRKADMQDSALFIARKMNNLAINEKTDTSYWYAKSLYYQGLVCESIYGLDSSQLYFWNSINSYKTYYEKSKSRKALSGIGLSFYKLHEYDSAIVYFKAYNQKLDLKSDEYCETSRNIGNIYRKIENYDSSLIYYKKCHYSSSEAKSKKSLYKLIAWTYFKLEQYDSSLVYYDLESKLYDLDKEQESYLSCISNQAFVYEKIGDFSKAHSFRKREYYIRDESGKRDEKYFNCFYNLCRSNCLTGDNYMCDSCYSILINQYESTILTDSLLIHYLLNAGNVAYENYNFKKANSLYLKAYNLFNTNPTSDILVYGGLVNGLGGLAYELGNYNQAEKYYLEAISAFESGNSIESVSIVYNNLALLYSDQKDFLNAEKFMQKSILSSPKLTSKSQMMSYSNFGTIFLENGNFEKSEEYMSKAESLLPFVVSKDKYIGNVLHNFGFYFFTIGNYEKAEGYFMRSLDFKRSNGSTEEEYALTLSYLARTYMEIDQFEQSFKYYSEWFPVKRNYLNEKFIWLSQSERLYYWNSEKKSFFHLFGLLSKSNAYFSAYTYLAYNSNLISKSLLLETSRELDQAISQIEDTIIKQNFHDLKLYRSHLSKMESEGSAKKELMDQLRTKADSLDKLLVNEVGEFAAAKKKFTTTWEDVQNGLEIHEVAIEYARYYDYDDSIYNYMAMIVRPGYEYPKVVKLGSEEAIKSLSPQNDYAELYNLIWEPIDSLLDGVKVVYYSPAGVLNNVAFSALCSGEELASESKTDSSLASRGITIESLSSSSSCTSYLMDKYELHQLTTTRYLADSAWKTPQSIAGSVHLYGGIDYDNVPSPVNEEEKDGTNEDYLMAMNLRSSSTTGKMKYLPGTKSEVENIEEQLYESNWQVNSYLGSNADENTFKSRVGEDAPGILHIATHGFAFPDVQQKENEVLSDEPVYKASDNPMVRCGLMLSGSNNSWLGEDEKMLSATGENGILSAAEVADMDLTNTSLVVLSACETGLGKIEGTEGVFGLKRGFKLAGVDQIIMSLWSVPDKETMELMTLFYEDLSNTLNPVVSFQKAQKQMRDRYPSEPYKWAGFVLVR